MAAIDRPQPLGTLVHAALREEIVTGELEMGRMLAEARIADRLQVSRTPVREAFAKLELEGLVRSVPQRGTFVATLGRDDLHCLTDVRQSLETLALHGVAANGGGDLGEVLARVVDRMDAAREAGDDRTYLALDGAYHEALIAAAGNPYLVDAYATISAKMAMLRNRLGDHPDHMAKSHLEHRRIARLITERSFGEAEAQLVAHIGRKEGSYWNI